MPHHPRVALDVETSRVYGRKILDGIAQYVRSHRPWSIYIEQQELGSTPADLLKSLPKPAGVLATNDARGQNVLNACVRENLAVPEQVAVIGVDNDELLCGLCSPPLTSIIPNPERIGYEAAELLDQMMAGHAPNCGSIEIPPIGVATRQSSDTLAIPDPEVAAALRFIREHACEGTTVQAVLAHVPVSRSWLERSFRKYLNRSPQAEIRNVQIKRGKELLTVIGANRRADGFRSP